MISTIGVIAMLDSEHDPMFVIDDQEYRLYLHDHKQIILEGCEKITLTPNEWARYQYRPKWYLKDHKYPVHSDWLVLWLNDMSSYMDFTQREYILIPNYTKIQELYNIYRTLRSKQTSSLNNLIL